MRRRAPQKCNSSSEKAAGIASVSHLDARRSFIRVCSCCWWYIGAVRGEETTVVHRRRRRRVYCTPLFSSFNRSNIASQPFYFSLTSVSRASQHLQQQQLQQQLQLDINFFSAIATFRRQLITDTEPGGRLNRRRQRQISSPLSSISDSLAHCRCP